MDAFETVLPLVIVFMGLLFILFPQQIGLGFCRLGKAIWSHGTFGLTDMRWLYPENEAPRMFRSMGIIMLLGGSIFCVVWFGLGSGPNDFTAIRQAREYLKSEYGKSPGGWSLSSRENTIDPKNPTSGYCMVDYRYAGHSGTLKAIWTTNNCFAFKNCHINGHQDTAPSICPPQTNHSKNAH